MLGVRDAGVPISVLSWEKGPDLADRDRVAALEARLDGAGVPWTRLRYHRTPSLPATAWDVARGRRVVRRWASATPGPRVVHARGYVPGLAGEAGVDRGALLLFDMRGFWVDERIEAGHWAPGSLPVRVGRWLERRVLQVSHHLILLTRRGVGRVGELAPGAGSLPASVIPTCVDTGRFRPAPDPAGARRALGLGEGPVLVHAGTLSGWYDGDATFSVARAFVARTGGRFVVLTREGERARSLAREHDVEPLIRSVPHDAMPAWLAASDAGLAWVRPSPAKDASYPTKVGEYLASGLAVLTTPMGDLPELADDGVVLLTDAEEDSGAAAARLAEAAARPDRRARARALAEAELSLEEGVDRLLGVYRELAARGADRP